MDPRDRSCSTSLGTAAHRRGLRSCLVVLLVLLSPASAPAQNPFTPLPSQPAQTTTTIPTTTTSSTAAAGNLSGAEQVGLIAAGLALIGGIAFLIRRDARNKAPVAARAAGSAQRGTAQPRAKRVERSRAQAKAGRKQRKRARRR